MHLPCAILLVLSSLHYTTFAVHSFVGASFVENSSENEAVLSTVPALKSLLSSTGCPRGRGCGLRGGLDQLETSYSFSTSPSPTSSIAYSNSRDLPNIHEGRREPVITNSAPSRVNLVSATQKTESESTATLSAALPTATTLPALLDQDLVVSTVFNQSVQLQKKGAKRKDKMCDPTPVDRRVDQLDLEGACVGSWGGFYDRIVSVTFNARTLESQALRISSFCSSPCGPLFDRQVREFRNACQEGLMRMEEQEDEEEEEEEEEMEAGEGEEGTWIPVPSEELLIYRMTGFIGTFGCAQDTVSGRLCAELIVRSLSASASANVGTPTGVAWTKIGNGKHRKADREREAAATAQALAKKEKCAYYTSCCFGEMMKTLRLGEQAELVEGLERVCPGAREAANASCSRSAASG
ncbi:hypothetical protein NGA_0115702 [Nannochloropsis gaditana CCMP526]|uniref:uncharacterized protein n=1 Tax=Nannochloropsis gaditana (strain CCMP526) TaxID=1093141 RepID=UPI00029F6477|nr:hypothetical protein NGA_0115702 [Nannochloropsis gaditana CCMP526]XP_005855416.1 hypothetical protein NGA_0115701 [Nannochloropsis gaditana CCMP526]EKU20947.1 hypothetical protein NGA_0115701 [Nannochloropsis gaditana CCMP526]EKU21595.1 hypothetical protein NGA_0115702 [Nannochloropsis gaditana CCMP526]|eukprot:XP_005854768.1 hypothetical protein NGA_0115702 [Nannochloropsis gaditana CCMP526]